MKCLNVLQVLAYSSAIVSFPSLVNAADERLTEAYQRPGHHTWVVPEGVDAVILELVGGGGGGGAAWVEEKWGAERRESFAASQRCYRDHDGLMDCWEPKYELKQIAGPSRITRVESDQNLYGLWCNNNINVYPQGAIDRCPGCFGSLNPVTSMEVGDHQVISCRLRGIDGGDVQVNAYISKLEHHTYQSNGGGAGQVVSYTIAGLHAGDVLDIQVGGGAADEGQATTVTVNGHTYRAVGGRKATAGDISGERGSAQSSSLIGMGGRASTAPGVNGESGFDGAVFITYSKPARVEILRQAAQLAQLFTSRVNRYARNFADGLDANDPIIEACVEAAVEVNGELASALLRIKRLNKKAEQAATELAIAREAFEKLLFETVAQHPELLNLLVDMDA